MLVLTKSRMLLMFIAFHFACDCASHQSLAFFRRCRVEGIVGFWAQRLDLAAAWRSRKSNMPLLEEEKKASTST